MLLSTSIIGGMLAWWYFKRVKTGGILNGWCFKCINGGGIFKGTRKSLYFIIKAPEPFWPLLFKPLPA